MLNTHKYDSSCNDIKAKSDTEFLQLYSESADIVFNNGEEQVVFIKDKDFNFSYVSPGHIKHIAPNALFGATNKITEEMRDTYAKLQQKVYEQDRHVKSKMKAGNFIYIDIYDRIGIVHKRPIINPATGNCVGVVGIAKQFKMPNILALIYKVHGIKFGLANQMHKEPLKYQLTKRQSMVLFLYLNKHSSSEVADIMAIIGHKISKSTVSEHLEKLKYIFQVKTKEQLIEKAISMGYHLSIPREFLQFGSFEVEDEVLIIN